MCDRKGRLQQGKSRAERIFTLVKANSSMVEVVDAQDDPNYQARGVDFHVEPEPRDVDHLPQAQIGIG